MIPYKPPPIFFNETFLGTAIPIRMFLLHHHDNMGISSFKIIWCPLVFAVVSINIQKKADNCPLKGYFLVQSPSSHGWEELAGFYHEHQSRLHIGPSTKNLFLPMLQLQFYTVWDWAILLVPI